MARKKREPGRNGEQQGASRPAAGGKSGTRCAACGTPSAPDAKFCHECGAPVGEASSPRWPSNAISIALLGALVAVVFAVVVGLAYLLQPESFQAPQSARPAAAPATQSSVDLSQMSPREAADRLFNRVMAADEQGNREEALRFAPKALQAYGRVEGLDADGHYHLGLLYGVTGDEENLRRQIGILREATPNHLLAFTLEHQLAQMSGDREAAARAVAALRTHYESEIATGRPEYDAHGVSIVQLLPEVPTRYTDAEGSFAAPGLAQGVPPGAGLFAGKCALCHGLDARGTAAKGPPLVHKIYEPAHHADEAFRRAVREGVRAHHWEFGDMPPVDGLSDEDLDRIIVYVRALQAAAGIE